MLKVRRVKAVTLGFVLTHTAFFYYNFLQHQHSQWSKDLLLVFLWGVDELHSLCFPCTLPIHGVDNISLLQHLQMVNLKDSYKKIEEFPPSFH